MPNKIKKGAKRMQKCFKCEADFAHGSLLEVKRGVRYCEPCHSSSFFKCGACEKTKTRNQHNPKRLGEMDVCEWCFFMAFRECNGCRVQKKTNDGMTTPSGNFYCTTCAPSAIFHCNYCEREHEIDRLWRRTPEDGPVCRGCEDRYMTRRHPPSIHSYSHKPPPEWQGKPKNKLYFGVELEVSHPKRMDDELAMKIKHNERAKFVQQAVPFVYVKSDSSIDNGFEIVSHPMGFDWIRENKSKFDPIWSLVKSGYVSHDSPSCGMHIHMSKDAFTRLQLYKFMTFFMKNEAFILAVSQRGSQEGLSRYSNIKYGREGERGPSLTSLAAGRVKHKHRYQAVNLHNERTVEIRIFRGTLKKERFFKNIEFCQALFDFTLTYSAADCIMEKFLGFITIHRDEYPNLYDFLAERYKWTIVNRQKRKGSKHKFGVKYSGTVQGVDVLKDASDIGWDEKIEAIKAEKDKKIEAAKLAHR